MKKDEIVYLEITSWEGISIGAEHFYGKLVGYNPEYSHIDVVKSMTQEEADTLSKKDDWDYEVGDETTRFSDREDIIQAALSNYKLHFPKAKVLILGRSSKAEPQKILDAPKKTMDKGNALFEEVDKLKWVNRGGMFHRSPKDEDLVDELTKKWRKLGL